MVTGIHQLSPLFERVKSRFDAHSTDSVGPQCKQGFYTGCQVLKLLKPAWTNDRMDRVENETGIFFSVWIDSKGFQTGRAEYNVHALKLRTLKGYSIASRDFASDFRRSFAACSSDWPNVSVQYGPLTLMQGWCAIGQDAEAELFSLLLRFEPLGELIDRLLETRRR